MRGGEGGTTAWERRSDSTIEESSYGTQLSPPSVDSGIVIEKEMSKEELLAILELYREVRGTSSDVTRLLDMLSQMEKYQVRSHRVCSRQGGGACHLQPRIRHVTDSRSSLAKFHGVSGKAIENQKRPESEDVPGGDPGRANALGGALLVEGSGRLHVLCETQDRGPWQPLC